MLPTRLKEATNQSFNQPYAVNLFMTTCAYSGLPGKVSTPHYTHHSLIFAVANIQVSYSHYIYRVVQHSKVHNFYGVLVITPMLPLAKGGGGEGVTHGKYCTESRTRTRTSVILKLAFLKSRPSRLSDTINLPTPTCICGISLQEVSAPH